MSIFQGLQDFAFLLNTINSIELYLGKGKVRVKSKSTFRNAYKVEYNFQSF